MGEVEENCVWTDDDGKRGKNGKIEKWFGGKFYGFCEGRKKLIFIEKLNYEEIYKKIFIENSWKNFYYKF